MNLSNQSHRSFNKKNYIKSKLTFPYTLVPYALCLVFTFNSLAQGVGINTTGSDAVSSAMLDVSSSGAPYQGMLIPRMTEDNRNLISSPALGLQIFNTTTNCLNLWVGNTWKQICGDCDFNVPIPGNNGPICEGSTLNLTATSILGATYQWTGPNGFTSTLQNPSILNATAAANGAYSVTATKNGCTCQAQSTVATVNNTPVIPTAGNTGPVCVGGLFNLTASTIVGAVYSWTGPNGYSASVQNPIITSAALTHTGTYNVTATVNGCISIAGTTTVVIFSSIPATPGSISGNTAVCPNSTGNVYSVSTVSNATSYTWTAPSGATITSGQNSTSITVTFGASLENITVTASNDCGTSSSASSTIISKATGGSITSVGGYTYHTFTTSGTFTPVCSGNVEYIVVAGGGSGGGGVYYSGGGGGGGVVTSTCSVTPTAYTVTIGNGGTGVTGTASGNNGSNSIFASFATAVGGGGGGNGANADPATPGIPGGSGGGGSGSGATTGTGGAGGAGTSGQGYAGGYGWKQASGVSAGGGGGGGAGAVGGNASNGQGGNGGVGVIWSNGSYYGGGGGAGTNTNNVSQQGTGGNGGGGRADYNTPVSGTANTGGGGGSIGMSGGSGTSGSGGSGIVIIRYPN